MKNKFLIEDISIMKKMNLLLFKKWGNSSNNYNNQKISVLIHSKPSHFLINYQECAVYEEPLEYHKKFYRKKISIIKLKELYEYYLNYLVFFCRPIFINFFYNTLIHYCYDVKADIFYKNNYKSDTKDDEIEDEKEEVFMKESGEKHTSDGKNIIKEKIEKINITIFDKETRNKIDNSNNIISSIRKSNEEEQNISFTQKIKLKDNSYITLRNNEDDLIEFINEIKFKNNIEKQHLKKDKTKEISLNHHSLSINKKMPKKYISNNINILANNISNKRKSDSCSEKTEYIKLITSGNKIGNMNNYKINMIKEKKKERINSLKNKKERKLEFNFKKSDIFNDTKKFKQKIIAPNKKNSFISTTDYFRNNSSISENKPKKIKTINNNINNVTNFKIISLNNKKLIISNKNNQYYNNTKKGKSTHIGRNSKNNIINNIYFNSKIKNSNYNNLLQTYLKNCPHFKKVQKSRSILRDKTKNISHSIDQMKTLSMRLIKSFNKKSKYHDKILRFIHNFKNNCNGSNNISINDKIKKRNKQNISNNNILKKSSSTSIIKRNREINKKNAALKKNELKFNVNLNLHSIFININPLVNYQQSINGNINNINNINKKIVMNSQLYENHNSKEKSMKITKNKKKINCDYKNKTQSYKRRNKTKNKIQKINYDKIKFKGTNSFIYFNTNLNNKNIKEENKILKRNNATVKLNKSNVSINTLSKIYLSINKKKANINNNYIDDKRHSKLFQYKK